MQSQSAQIVSEDKNYWLVRTQGGKYYDEFRRGGFIGINWNEISWSEIESNNRKEIISLLKDHNPDVRNPSNAARQLTVFRKVMKKGDTVIITGRGSRVFSIGEIVDDEFTTAEITPEQLANNPRLCPYEKRRNVTWLKELTKWEVEMPMFKLLQHAQQTITDAGEYQDYIESKIHDFFIRGNNAQLTLRVKREGHIPAVKFFTLGKELLDLAEEFLESIDDSSAVVDIDKVETQINLNSPGNFNFKGPTRIVTVVGLFVLIGTGVNIDIPTPTGDPLHLETPGVAEAVTKFLNDKQEREHRQQIIDKYLDQLEVEKPEDLQRLLESTENSSNAQ